MLYTKCLMMRTVQCAEEILIICYRLMNANTVVAADKRYNGEMVMIKHNKQKSKEIQKIIVDYIKELNVSLKELSEKTGYTEKAFEYWIKGERVISLDAADIVLNQLGLSITLGDIPEEMYICKYCKYYRYRKAENGISYCINDIMFLKYVNAIDKCCSNFIYDQTFDR